MKRGKDDEKIMEPMFPRLHVNDTEKGGPRAPPRNKMALYEQFSIPSQRSLSQGGDHQMNAMSSPLRVHRSTLPAEESYSAYSNSSPPSAQLDKKKKLDEEDFTVPVFVEAETGQDHSKYPVGMDRGKLFSSSPTYSGQNSSDREPKRARSQLHNSRCRNDVSNESEGGVENGMSSSPSRDSCPEELGRPNNSTFDCLYHEDETRGSLHIGNGDRGDDASETSMVDSIPVFDISPDDVVGVIGQKHFWKARRAIVNQQRVFAVQVFELHRLMKVQKSFAGSLQLLVEDDSYSGKPLKVSVAKKLPLELIIEPSHDAAMHKDDSDKRNQRMECSAENAVGKTSIPSVQNVSRPSNCRPQSTPTVTDDAKTSPPWCFHQPTGQQWLIPVMSPSEGLIYKPYNPGHGIAGPLCSGYGLLGSNPMMGNFRYPAYDFPSSYHHYQPPVSHGYFPPYGMPFLSPVYSGSAVEQAANHFTGLGSRSQLSGGGANFSTQRQQRPCTVPTQKNNDTVISNAVKPHAATKECKLQGSTVSSHATEARNSLPQLHGTDQPTKVIKVVPHNAVSATESVARIFQCIQQERKQQESD